MDGTHSQQPKTGDIMQRVNVNLYGNTVVNLESDSLLTLADLIINMLDNRGAIDDEGDDIAIAESVQYCADNSEFFRWSGFLFTFYKL